MNKEVKETSEYDNCLDISKRIDEYGLSLDKFYDDDIQVNPVDQTKAKKKSDCFKEIYIHFRNGDDLIDFCHLIGWSIHRNEKEIFYPSDRPSKIDRKLILPKKKIEDDVTLDEFVEEKQDKWQTHWKEMPEFVQEENPPYRSITIKFNTQEDVDRLSKVIKQEITDKTKSIWHPKLEITKNYLLRWIQPEGNTDTKYPLYVVSKGRWESMYTSRSLARMKIPHYVVIEPQEYEQYEQSIHEYQIQEYTTLLIAPFSNHGDGPGRARNWAWDHSQSIVQAKRHWVLDDNISDFYRLNKNQRIRVESGVFFRVMEDFVDRYDNVPIAGPQYRFFIAPNQKYPPFVLNTRVYSTLLIDNNCKHRWRGRYNEDTDICLRVLKDGDCTIQFNAFMQGKAATQTVRGGNTQEFYHAEGTLDKEKYRNGHLNSEGTINKSKMLVDMHPDVARMVFRYGRWHHWVDYSPFKKNKLKLKDDLPKLSNVTNEYGMKLITLEE